MYEIPGPVLLSYCDDWRVSAFLIHRVHDTFMNLWRALWRWPVIQRTATYRLLGPFVISHPETKERRAEEG